MKAFTSTSGIRFSERKGYVRVDQNTVPVRQIDSAEFGPALKEYVEHVRDAAVTAVAS